MSPDTINRALLSFGIMFPAALPRRKSSVYRQLRWDARSVVAKRPPGRPGRRLGEKTL